MIREALAGRRIAVTGATGFLGTALVERLLRTIPDCHLVLIVRPGRRGAADRVRREILRNDCFDRLRSDLGDRFDATVAERMTVVAGDVGQDGLGLDAAGREALAGCRTVIHSAASVSFDSPLDAAVEVNLLGPTRLAEAIRQATGTGAGSAPAHLVAVSTAYVAGSRRGEAAERVLTETPFATEVGWRAEVVAARRARGDTDAASRDPALLHRFARQARAELGAAGTPVLAAKAERLREDWVKERMVTLGKARARALGWPDAYAYTKALGERALLETRGDVPVTIVRPSIIESALSEPTPGWIRGFRMAEPVIISYGRGLLKEFPGLPEGVVDVIPVDLVVAAVLGVAARGPAADGRPDVFQVASGARNPLRYRQLVDLVRGGFLDHPLVDRDGQPIVVPEWSFPGRGRVQRQLQQATRSLSRAEKVLQALPIRGRQAEWTARLEERRTEAERALGYVELYGAYTETEAIFRVERLIGLWDTLPPADRAEWCFDPAVIDWSRYVRDIHLPSVVVHARVRTTPGSRHTGGSTGLSRADRGRRAVLARERQLAVFDLENTLIASNVVESYAWLATRRLDDTDRIRFSLRTLREAPRLLALDRQDRGDFLRSFYRRYEGAPVERLRRDSWELFSDLILTKSFPAGIRRVREHRAAGHRTLLITGALDMVIEPLGPLFDDIVCASLGERDGRFTGELVDAPPTGEARAMIMAAYAAEHGLNLQEAVAYADSASDLPMLEAVGHPVAVNPEVKLAAIARKRGWHVEHWPRPAGGPRPLLPIGPLTVKALLFERSLPKLAAARVASEWRSGGGVRVGPLRLADVAEPHLPGPAWQRVRPRLAGICGSDLATVDGRSSRYFEPIVSFPFTPGHEVVGDLDDGTRVVLEPVLRCAVRGIDPPCPACLAGQTNRCRNLAFGHLEPGLQTGYCADTGGGWGIALVAHDSQLHPVPEAMADEAAVMVEPAACAVHGALSGPPDGAGRDLTAVVIGAGTLGLCTIAALSRYRPAVTSVIAVAKHPEQRRLAGQLGAATVVEPGELRRAVRRRTGSFVLDSGQLTGGASTVFDCVGTADSLADALAVVEPGGTIVLLGMPGRVSVDLTGLWQREVSVTGAYAYGTERLGGTPRRTFDLAFELVAEAGLERLVSATYPLERFREAVDHAAHAGRRGAVKVAFDLRKEKRR